MPDFKSKTREELQGITQQKPGYKVPIAEYEGLRELGATEFYPRIWQYRHKTHTLNDLTRPGYFGGEIRNNLRPGDEIHFCLEGGKKLPSEWTRGILAIEDIPNTRELPVIVAAIILYPTAKICSGEQEQAA